MKKHRELLDIILDNLLYEVFEKRKCSERSIDIEVSREFYEMIINEKTEGQVRKLNELKGVGYTINYSQMNPYKFV